MDPEVNHKRNNMSARDHLTILEGYRHILKDCTKDELAFENCQFLDEVYFLHKKSLESEALILKLTIALDVIGIPPQESVILDQDFLIWLKKCPDVKDLNPKELFELQMAWYRIETLLSEVDSFSGHKSSLSSLSDLKMYMDKLK